MAGISDTIRRLQTKLEGLATAVGPGSSRLRPLPPFGSNPGNLNGWFHVPAATGPMALVVVLHGCTQTAAGYDHGSGWSELAERAGFAVLFPEQQRANNANLCFNWFSPEDSRRDGGEALSIRQMIAAMADAHPIDRNRVFVTGLSAGGAMTSVMLATYPELFAGGSIVAGLPYAAATTVPEAFERMRGAGHASAANSAAAVRRASPHAGPWPRITVWHGDADRTVDESNADAIVGQWRTLHGAASTPATVELVDGQRHRVWLDRAGRPAIDEYRIAGMGHGTPLRTRGNEGCGIAGPYMLEAGISSTWRQAQNWGLLTGPVSARAAPQDAAPEPTDAMAAAAASLGGAGATIERALRSVGLMR